MSIDYVTFFDGLCRDLGFCSIDPEAQDRINRLASSDPETITRAVFDAEGLDYDTYAPDRVRREVRAYVERHLNREI